MIRAYRPSDLPALRRICLLTGDAGRDATGLYSDDGLLPDIFLEPYVTLLPHLAWVAEADARPVGYVVSAMDTWGLAQRWRTEWSPVFAARHPRSARQAGDAWLFDWGETANGMLNDIENDFPAHFHIDLLPEAQGRGLGRALMRQLGLTAVVAGVPGVHLVMDPANGPAVTFYRRLGFEEFGIDNDALIMGISAPALASV